MYEQHNIGKRIITLVIPVIIIANVVEMPKYIQITAQYVQLYSALSYV